MNGLVPSGSYTVGMPETRDKRRREDLDIFVLALIEKGISTPYDLQKRAALSPGATIPALGRLLRAGYLLQKKPGPRGRTEHTITSDGREHLMVAWRMLIEEGPSGDPDADLRVALLAIWVGGDLRRAVDFLRRSAARIRQSTGGSTSTAMTPTCRPSLFGTESCAPLRQML